MSIANLTLTNPTGAVLEDTTLQIPIKDTESAYKALTMEVTTTGFPSGNAQVTVKLNRAHSADVTVDYATSDGDAKAGEDYTATNGTLTIPAGQTSAVIQVPIL